VRSRAGLQGWEGPHPLRTRLTIPHLRQGQARQSRLPGRSPDAPFGGRRVEIAAQVHEVRGLGCDAEPVGKSMRNP